MSSPRFTSERWRNFKETLRRVLSEDPENCRCPVCSVDWQSELDKEEDAQ